MKKIFFLIRRDTEWRQVTQNDKDMSQHDVIRYHVATCPSCNMSVSIYYIII